MARRKARGGSPVSLRKRVLKMLRGGKPDLPRDLLDRQVGGEQQVPGLGPAVISAPSGNLYLGFSGVYVVIRNLSVRTYDNPQISGIDLHHAAQCRLENVVVSTGVYNVQASQPTHGTTGLVTPANNNAALTILRNVLVTGYDPSNLGIGDITYWVVIGGVGAVDTFTKNGGTGIRARRIGSAP